MVCDGLSLGVSYARAGFTSKAQNAARDLFNRPHVQRRAEAVLEARRTQGVVTLPEVTDMLKRVFAGANSEGEYSAAHNAAFSLARLYGHVTDKATLEVLRRPSREPDAPSEQVLGDWVAGLPGPVIDGHVVEASQPSGGPLRGAPAPLLGLEPQDPSPTMLSADNNASEPSPSEVPHVDVHMVPGPGPGATRGMEIENGAPVGPVTGTPSAGRRAASLGRGKQKQPAGTKRVPAPGGLDRSPPKAGGGPVKKPVKSAAEKRKARKLRAEMKDLFG